MSLTSENTETTDDMLNVSAMWRDIARMDDVQLETYMKGAFTGTPDYSFLSYPFWSRYFSMRNFGSSPDGKSPPGPGAFLAEMHDIIGSVSRGSYRVEGEAPDFEFRPRFRKVLGKIMNEVALVDDPAEDEKLIARHAIDALNHIQPEDVFRGEGDMFNVNRIKEGSPQSLEYPQYLKDDLKVMDEQIYRILENATEIVGSGKFGI